MKLKFLKSLNFSMVPLFKLPLVYLILGAGAVLASFASAGSNGEQIRFADQGAQWTAEARSIYYTQDQGSQLIPLAWLAALHQPDGQAFAADALARYGYLPNHSAANKADLPIGFSLADSQQGPMVGMTCSACHERQINVGTVSYRIDGGPAFADFQSFIVDLDTAVLRVLASDAAFAPFAQSVLGQEAAKPEAASALHDAVALWSLRFHTIVSQSVPADKPWGPGRLDAIAMIYNRLNGLDLGPPPTFILPGNMEVGDAPARYPFLWNAGRQDHTQWGGWAANGNQGLALARNLGQVLGVFAAFHPNPKSPALPLDHDYLSANSANIAGLTMAEGVLMQLGPPAWPFPVDMALAERGKAIFNKPASMGGCSECHGIAEGEARGPGVPTLKTGNVDAGTDLRQWQIVLRQAKSGSLEGAIVPGVVGPLKATDLSLNILKAAVTGTLVDVQAAQADAAQAQASPKQQPEAMAKSEAPSPAAMITHDEMMMTMRAPDMPAKMEAPAKPAQAPSLGYEARVLQGVWAAAPYLHNGSVPSLAELLKPSAQRIKAFKIGPAYDIQSVGLASEQTTDFTLTTTGCEDRASGNSNCGHDYGTQLPDDEKKALLEYLKTL